MKVTYTVVEADRVRVLLSQGIQGCAFEVSFGGLSTIVEALLSAMVRLRGGPPLPELADDGDALVGGIDIIWDGPEPLVKLELPRREMRFTVVEADTLRQMLAVAVSRIRCEPSKPSN